jgi:hypothetical protein
MFPIRFRISLSVTAKFINSFCSSVTFYHSSWPPIISWTAAIVSWIVSYSIERIPISWVTSCVDLSNSDRPFLSNSTTKESGSLIDSIAETERSLAGLFLHLCDDILTKDFLHHSHSIFALLYLSILGGG